MKYSTMNYAIYDEGNATYTLKVCLSNSIFSTNYRLNDHARAKMIINHQEVGGGKESCRLATCHNLLFICRQVPYRLYGHKEIHPPMPLTMLTQRPFMPINTHLSLLCRRLSTIPPLLPPLIILNPFK